MTTYRRSVERRVPRSLVRAGAKALRDIYPPEGSPGVRPAPLYAAEQVLTAALRLDDPETVERVAKAIFVAMDPESTDSWEDVSDRLREECRNEARAAINALLNTTDDEEAGERNVCWCGSRRADQKTCQRGHLMIDSTIRP